MNNFLYPRDLYERLTKLWKSAPFTEGWPKVELPEPSVLNALLDVCYHASFLVEEGRRITFRAVYIDTTTYLRPPGASDGHPTALYAFDKPLTLTPKELCRLAPAADPNRVLIAINQSEGVPPTLQIRGLVDIGSSLWAHRRHQRSSGHGPPDALIVAVTKPGHLTIARSDKVIIRLVNGELAQPTQKLLLRGPVSEFFFEADDWFIEEAWKQSVLYKEQDHENQLEETAALSPNEQFGKLVLISPVESAELPEDEDDERDDDFTFSYQTILEMILFALVELGHGGTIFIVPDELPQMEEKLRKFVNIKYAAPSSRPQQVLLHKMAVRLLWNEQFRHIYNAETITNSVFQEYEEFDWVQEDAADSVADVAKFIAGLTAVDGAVILTDKLRLLGFGAEVLAAAKSLATVRSTESELAVDCTEVPISAYGTRHRSAFRFCSSIEPSVGFIVSQDGGIKALRKVNGKLTMWPYFEIGINSEM